MQTTNTPEWAAWKNHPKTQEFLADLRSSALERTDDFVMARVTEHGDIRFLQGFAQALAKVADGIEGIRAGEPDAQ